MTTGEGPTGPGTVRILHVDDDQAMTDLVDAYLGRHEHRWAEVNRAHSAAEGVERLEREQFDCVVSDYSMPETNGLQFLEAVQRVDPDLPFVLFTGRGSEEIASRAISAGVTDYIQKGGAEQLTLLENRIKHAVTKRSLGLKATQESQKFRAVFERASDAMLLADDAGRYVDANPEACALFGVERAELLGRTAADFARSDFDFEAAWRRFKASDREYGRFPLRRPDGTAVEVEYSATPDIISGVNLSILRPVTDGHRSANAP